VNFAIDVQFTQATRNQLRHLATKVDDEKAVMYVCHAICNMQMWRCWQGFEGGFATRNYKFLG
jgi:hypothetical protein